MPFVGTSNEKGESNQRVLYIGPQHDATGLRGPRILGVSELNSPKTLTMDGQIYLNMNGIFSHGTCIEKNYMPENHSFSKTYLWVNVKKTPETKPNSVEGFC